MYVKNDARCSKDVCKNHWGICKLSSADVFDLTPNKVAHKNVQLTNPGKHVSRKAPQTIQIHVEISSYQGQNKCMCNTLKNSFRFKE